MLAPMRRLADTVEAHMEEILAHWKAGLTTAFMEGPNSVFSAVKRRRGDTGARSYMITMLYFVAGKLPLPTHSN